MEIERSAGVLLHPTCLPSRFGIGDLGPAADAYLEWLAGAGVRWWQVLPLNPPGPGFSPYSATSTFAGNPLMISPELMVGDGLLDERELAAFPALPAERVGFDEVVAAKGRLLHTAWERLMATPPGPVADDLERFAGEQARWLEEFVVYDAIRSSTGGEPWYEWPERLRLHREADVREWADAHCEEVGFSRFCQFLFFRQWGRLRERAAARGVRFLGDVPIFVAYDSAEVWAHRELFLLDEDGAPTVVAGVPPDYFSTTGQRWGNPLYDWDRHREDGYAWWVSRLGHAAALCDAVRLDHFRGFVAHWEIPGAEETAVAGRWVSGPGRELFDAVREALGGLPFVAEDLGTITEDVHQLRHGLGLPGMAILQFAFSDQPRSTYIPYNLTRDLVVYTGTHDNNTTVGWWLEDASEEEKDLARRYMAADGREINWDLVRLTMSSVCDLAVVPHQDLAGLGADCRMNTPGLGDGNWAFRLAPWMLERPIQERLAALIETYGR